jgi:hypothetical protein
MKYIVTMELDLEDETLEAGDEDIYYEIKHKNKDAAYKLERSK